MSFLLSFLKKIKFATEIEHGEGAEEPAVTSYIGCYESQEFVFLKSLETPTRGALGKSDIQIIIGAMNVAIERNLPVLLYLNSAGAKLDEGVAIQASFRRLIRKAIELNMSGSKFIVLMGPNVFGGASMLSMCGNCRVYEENTKIAMTGSKVLRQYNDSTTSRVNDLISSSSRAKEDDSAYFIDQDAQLDQIINFELSTSKHLRTHSNRNLAKLAFKNQNRPTRIHVDKNTIRCNGTEPPTISELITLIDYIERFDKGENYVIECQWASHSLDLNDEFLLQSKWLVDLAICLRKKSLSGCRITTLVTNSISGGLYIAFAAGSDFIKVQPGAEVLSLPPSVVNLIKTSAIDSDNDKKSVAQLIDLGVIDSI